MNLRLVLALAAVAGGLAALQRRRRRQDAADAALWAEATDPVAPTGTA